MLWAGTYVMGWCDQNSSFIKRWRAVKSLSSLLAHLSSVWWRVSVVDWIVLSSSSIQQQIFAAMSVNLIVPGQEQQQQLRHSISIPASTTTNTNAGSVLSVPDNQAQPRGIMRAKSVGPETPNKTSRRVNLGPGCGLLDWIRLTRSKKDIAGNGGTMLLVTEEELAEHCTEQDAWTCVRGRHLHAR